MADYHAEISAEIRAPIETVFDRLADHNAMGTWLNADIRRTKDSSVTAEGVNGTGSVRTLRIFSLLDFDETVVRFEKPRSGVAQGKEAKVASIEYKITRGSPLKNHHGTITLDDAGGKVTIAWNIIFDMAFPLVGHVVALLLKFAITDGLKKLAKQLEAS